MGGFLGIGTVVAVRLTTSLCAGACLILAVDAARGVEICVKCTEPEASYACVVRASEVDTASKLYCITALAKAGPHASCAIDRNMTAPCPGPRKELPVPAGLDSVPGEPQHESGGADTTLQPGAIRPEVSDGPPAVPSVGAATSTATDAAEPRNPDANAPPKTVQEIVEKGAKSAGDGITETQKTAEEAAKSATTALEKAGAAVTGAAKNSWKCLSSFFSNC